MAKPRYGRAHQAARAAWTPRVNTGTTTCQAPICLLGDRTIRPGQAWDLGHTPDGTAYTGPEHARCNRSEGSTRRQRQLGRTGKTPTIRPDPINDW